MRSALQVTVTAITCLFVLPAIVSLARPQKTFTPEQAQIVETVGTLLAAAREENVASFNSVLAPDFYIFDGGSRYNGESLMGLVRSLHAAGKRYEWNVTEPDVHITGDTAWITYVNKGSITDASGNVQQQWLESAFLQKEQGVWKIVFMHSTRVPNPARETSQHIHECF